MYEHNLDRSLLEIFSSGKYVNASGDIGLTEWRNWMPHAAWNQWCIREGFNCNGPAPMVDGNVSDGFRLSGMGKARLGIIFSGYPDCKVMEPRCPYANEATCRSRLYNTAANPAVLIGIPPFVLIKIAPASLSSLVTLSCCFLLTGIGLNRSSAGARCQSYLQYNSQRRRLSKNYPKSDQRQVRTECDKRVFLIAVPVVCLIIASIAAVQRNFLDATNMPEGDASTLFSTCQNHNAGQVKVWVRLKSEARAARYAGSVTLTSVINGTTTQLIERNVRYKVKCRARDQGGLWTKVVRADVLSLAAVPLAPTAPTLFAFVGTTVFPFGDEYTAVCPSTCTQEQLDYLIREETAWIAWETPDWISGQAPAYVTYSYQLTFTPSAGGSTCNSPASVSGTVSQIVHTDPALATPAEPWVSAITYGAKFRYVYQMTGLLPGTQYTATVSAISSGGKGPPSEGLHPCSQPKPDLNVGPNIYRGNGENETEHMQGDSICYIWRAPPWLSPGAIYLPQLSAWRSLQFFPGCLSKAGILARD